MSDIITNKSNSLTNIFLYFIKILFIEIFITNFIAVFTTIFILVIGSILGLLGSLFSQAVLYNDFFSQLSVFSNSFSQILDAIRAFSYFVLFVCPFIFVGFSTGKNAHKNKKYQIKFPDNLLFRYLPMLLIIIVTILLTILFYLPVSQMKIYFLAFALFSPASYFGFGESNYFDFANIIPLVSYLLFSIFFYMGERNKKLQVSKNLDI